MYNQLWSELFSDLSSSLGSGSDRIYLSHFWKCTCKIVAGAADWLAPVTADGRASCSSGVRVQGLGLRVQGSGFRVQGSGFRVQGSGSRIRWHRHRGWASPLRRDWCFIAKRSAPEPHLARPEGHAALTHMYSLLYPVSVALASPLRKGRRSLLPITVNLSGTTVCERVDCMTSHNVFMNWF
jgi:hypothetical protein